MQQVKIKPENNNVPVNITVTPSLNSQLTRFAKKHGVSRAAAVRYIVSLFFTSDFSKSEHENGQS